MMLYPFFSSSSADSEYKFPEWHRLCRPGLLERSLLGAFYEDHIDHPIDKPGLGIIKRAAAAARIGRAIKLEYGISCFRNCPSHFRKRPEVALSCAPVK